MLAQNLRIGLPAALSALRYKVFAEVSVRQACEHVHSTGEQHEPRGLEVQVTAPAILVRHYILVGGGYGIARGWDVQGEGRFRHHIAYFSPVEAWMRDDDFQPADEQGEEGNDHQPMGA